MGTRLLIILTHLLQIIAWPVAVLYLYILYGFRVRQSKDLKDEHFDKVIFAVNHTSLLDPIIVRAALPILSKGAPMFYVARPRKTYSWTGWRSLLFSDSFFLAWGAYPVHSGEKNYEHSLREFFPLAQRKGSICIFPTGFWRRDDLPKEARGGVVYLSHKTKRPIVPVHITRIGHIPRSFFLSRGARLLVSFGKPIFPHELAVDQDSHESFKKVAQNIYRNIEEMEKNTIVFG